jgi:hypothetical protein
MGASTPSPMWWGGVPGLLSTTSGLQCPSIKCSLVTDFLSCWFLVLRGSGKTGSRSFEESCASADGSKHRSPQPTLFLRHSTPKSKLRLRVRVLPGCAP